MSQVIVGCDGIYELEEDGTRRLLTRTFASLDRMDPPRDYLWMDPFGKLLCVTRDEFKRLRRARRRDILTSLAALAGVLAGSYALFFGMVWLLWRVFH